ncbi:hypothetical protein EON63_04150, partial [archaeon]
MTGDEGWAHVDALGDNVCGAMDYIHQDIRKIQTGTYSGTYPDPEYIYPSHLLPHVLHYCQFYRVGEWGFQKRRFRKKMLTCDGEYMRMDYIIIYSMCKYPCSYNCTNTLNTLYTYMHYHTHTQTHIHTHTHTHISSTHT